MHEDSTAVVNNALTVLSPEVLEGLSRETGSAAGSAKRGL